MICVQLTLKRPASRPLAAPKVRSGLARDAIEEGNNAPPAGRYIMPRLERSRWARVALRLTRLADGEVFFRRGYKGVQEIADE